jgi:GGDEF domain-containing protein
MTGEQPQRQDELLERYRKVGIELAVGLVGSLRTNIEAIKESEQYRIDKRSGLLQTDVYNNELQNAIEELRGDEERRLDVPNYLVQMHGDIKGLKAVNEGRGGHAAGHIIIGNAGAMMRSFIGSRRNDKAGRLGGDEFGLSLFFHAEDDESAKQILETVEERFLHHVIDTVEQGLIPGLAWCFKLREADETAEELLNNTDPKKEENKGIRQEYPLESKDMV